MSDILERFAKDPFGFIKRVFFKKIIGPLKYGKEDDYDAANYWDSRLGKYGDNLKGAGDEGKSHEDNVREYKQDENIFTGLVKKPELDFANISVMDIGCGTGFYTDILQRLGVKKYTGIDITDTLFAKHKENFGDYEFVKKDIATEKVEGKYDLIIMIEVLEHIVNDDKLSFAMENVKNCLAENGVFIISSIWKKGKKHMFYVRRWTLDEIKQRFEGYIFSEPTPFRSANIIIIRK
jgi:2-polyprenyl-3-methyl-5-hydroxy-6-metoxy-1,4-benzoquinol methylase